MNESTRSSVERRLDDEDGTSWIAFAADAIVAHGRPGAVLAFRPDGATDNGTLRSTVTFNSFAAADFALRTMSTREIGRRLALARMAAGGV
jgi:hypothetical protein